jgi:integrase
MSQDLELHHGQLRSLLPHINTLARNSQCKIRAVNDIEAIERWLSEYFEKATTYRSYKKEAERFLTWCVLVQNTSLTTLSREDVDAYINFMQNPVPREKWCGPKGGRKKNSDTRWYPFTGPLGTSAIKTSLAILNSLMNYLVQARYADFNPFVLMRRKTRFQDKFSSPSLTIAERILTPREWEAVIQALDNELDAQKKQRSSFLLTILFLLGLRIEELAQATWSQFRQINNKWWFFVHGKGDRLGKIPVNAELLQAVITYRHAQHLSPLPKATEINPVISKLKDQQQGLSARQMSNVIKNLAYEAAELFPDEPLVQQKLKKLSPHWLRHLSASCQDLAGISFTHIKQNLRHQNEQTTRHYVHAFDDERHKDMEKLRIRGKICDAL